MRKKLAVVHWLPVEMYPPAVNLVRYFSESGRWDVSLHTSANHHGRPAFEHPGVRVHRSSAAAGRRALPRAGAYAAFHLGMTLRLLRSRPDVVLYVEPQSSFPVYLASLFRPSLPLFIHHHEYHDPEQFLRPGMRLTRWFHGLEARRLFGRADWISHTNDERLRRFLNDHPHVDPAKGRILPNLPPASWFGAPNRAWGQAMPPPLRMVYVGSLSRQDTYIEEVVSWVHAQEKAVTLDIFSYNLHEETRRFLEAAEGRGVCFFSEGIAYDDLPEVLRGYHTGLLLYKANTTNYRFNASNKLFEYLACGLDVVYPHRMLGVKPFARRDVYPRVLEVDFETGKGIDLGRLSARGPMPKGPEHGSAREALALLENAMLDALGEKKPCGENDAVQVQPRR